MLSNCNLHCKFPKLLCQKQLSKNLPPRLIWAKLFLSNFRETKAGARPFKAGTCLFEQESACFKQTAARLKLVANYSEGAISRFLKC